MIGGMDNELKSIMPYCLHRADRRKNFEPFQIESNIKGFFDRFGYGNPENTTILLGKITNGKQREDAKFCRDKGFECTHVSDLKDKANNLFSEIETEIDLLPKEKKAKLTRDFEPIRKKCLNDME